MLSRSLQIPLIVVFWCVTSGWLVVEKILPSLSPGAPPGYQAFYASGNRLVPVAWTVMWNEQPLGWAFSRSERTEDGGMEVYSLLHFDRLPIDEVLPPWAKLLLRQSFDPGTSYVLDAKGHLSIDGRGDLRAFDSVVTVPESDCRVILEGRINDGEVSVDVRTNGVTYSVSRHLPRHISISDELSPQATLPGLYPGRQWTVPVYSPLRPGQAPIQILHAKVEGEESMFWDDKLVRVDVVSYREDPAPHREPKCRLWVDRAGKLLKQESLMLGSKLVFVRRTDAAAEDLVSGVVTGSGAVSVADPAPDSHAGSDRSAAGGSGTGVAAGAEDAR